MGFATLFEQDVAADTDCGSTQESWFSAAM